MSEVHVLVASDSESPRILYFFFFGLLGGGTSVGSASETRIEY
jgi:hypothetical protein